MAATIPAGISSSAINALSGNFAQDWGDFGRLNDIPPGDSQWDRVWGAPNSETLFLGNIGAGQAVGTVIANGNFCNPFQFAVLEDIQFSCTAHEATPTTCTIDVFDTFASGTTAAAHSFLTGPFSIAASLASAARFASAKSLATPLLYTVFDPRRYPGYPGALGILNWSNDTLTAYNTGTRAMPLMLPMGQEFSVRCATTASTGAITNLAVTLVLRPVSAAFFNRR